MQRCVKIAPNRIDDEPRQLILDVIRQLHSSAHREAMVSVMAIYQKLPSRSIRVGPSRLPLGIRSEKSEGVEDACRRSRKWLGAWPIDGEYV